MAGSGGCPGPRRRGPGAPAAAGARDAGGLPRASEPVAAGAAPPVIELDRPDRRARRSDDPATASTARSRGRVDRPARPERRGQVDADQHAARLPHARPRGPRASSARDIREAKALRRLIGYMPENDAFISHMSGVRFVRLMAELAGLPPEPALERAHEAFFYVGPRRGALPQARHLLAGHEAARQAGPGDRARPAAAVPRRAHERPRPAGAPAHDPADPRDPRRRRDAHRSSRRTCCATSRRPARRC